MNESQTHDLDAELAALVEEHHDNLPVEQSPRFPGARDFTDGLPPLEPEDQRLHDAVWGAEEVA